MLICLLELGFGFDQSLPRGKPVGKSPYYRSFDRSANWRVKDSIVFPTPPLGSPLSPYVHDHVTFVLARLSHGTINGQSASDHGLGQTWAGETRLTEHGELQACRS